LLAEENKGSFWLAQVAPAVPLNKTLHYRIPSSLVDGIVVGSMVVVPLGSRRVTGYVVSVAQASAVEGLKLIQEVLGFFFLSAVVHPYTAEDLFPSKENIVDHGHGIDQRHILVNGRNAGLCCIVGIFEPEGLSFEPDLSFIVRVDTGKDLDERGFPRTVFACQNMDFTWVEVKTHIIQDFDTGEGLGDVLHNEHRFSDLCIHNVRYNTTHNQGSI